jgi:O-antigen/teichoic acid export membrane protein
VRKRLGFPHNDAWERHRLNLNHPTIRGFLENAHQASVVLVLQGFGYLGLAWATVISGATWTLLGLCVRRDFSVYRPSLAEWRSVLAFGAYGSATAVLYRSSESLFNLILSKMLDARAVGLFQRAVMLSQFPEKVILAGVGTVALPAFSDHARQGGASCAPMFRSFGGSSPARQ